jgi:hypothetical protein
VSRRTRPSRPPSHDAVVASMVVCLMALVAPLLLE